MSSVLTIPFAAVRIQFTEVDYHTPESGQLQVLVSKDSRIASPITMTVSPLTIDEAVASGISLPFSVPIDNPLSPFRASEFLLGGRMDDVLFLAFKVLTILYACFGTN